MSDMPFTHLRDDIGVLFVRGTDARGFVDGLSTNQIPNDSGHAVQTVFTDRAAKIIAATLALVRDEGVVLLVYRPSIDALIGHLQPRLLGQDVALMDISDRNHVVYEVGGTSDVEFGRWNTHQQVTTVRLTPELLVHIAAGPPAEAVEANMTEWTAWRVEHRWPEHGLEITAKRHPYACGLEDYVHQNKGCFLGQEVLARMKSRGRTGWVLVQGDVNALPEHRITTEHEGRALAILRTSEVQ
ncbi:MAG TPA: hypothetical protein HA286_00250 [Candidatus Poseidoniaceae archaeon]|nr:hypothetical protein [Candidatus Poseidoniaceae archaeon]